MSLRLSGEALVAPWADYWLTQSVGDGELILIIQCLKPLGTLTHTRSFLGQAPIFIVAMLLCAVLLPDSTVAEDDGQDEGTDTRSRLARIDGLGALLLGSGILALLLPMEIGGQKVSWHHPLIFSLLAGGVLLLFLFVLVESRWAKEPVFPLRLFHERNVTMSFFIMAAQSGAQLGVSTCDYWKRCVWLIETANHR